MATFHCHARSGKSCKSAGARHLDYILGDGKYSDKNEVIYCEDGNLPDFASTGKEFFTLADQSERANGRSYFGLTISIPNESGNPVSWSRQLIQAIVGGQAYSFAVHLKDGNPHLHVMFSERTNNRTLPPQKYFSRANKKIRAYTEKSWLKQTKNKYLEHIRMVAPGYVPTMAGGKEKQFSPSQPEKIAGAQAERILSRLLAQEKAIYEENIVNVNQGERKMINEQIIDKNALLSAPPTLSDEDLSQVYGATYEQCGMIENADPRPASDKTYQYRLAQQIYTDAFALEGLTYCRINNKKYVVMWFADKSKIVDQGNLITATEGESARDTARRLVELAGKHKGWTRLKLSGSEAFVSEAMLNCVRLGLEVEPADENQRLLWKRILSESKPITAQVIAHTNSAHVVPTLAGLGEKLGKRLANSPPTPKRGRGFGV